MVAIIGSLLVLNHPRWVATLIESGLQQRGINTSIQALDGGLDGWHYHVDARLSIDAPYQGFRAKYLHLNAVLNWRALLQGQAFIDKLTVSNAEISIAQYALSPLRKTVQARRYRAVSEHYLPKKWRLDNIIAEFSNQAVSISGYGEGSVVKRLSLIQGDNQVLVSYDPKQFQLHIKSDRLNLTRLTGYPVMMKDIKVQLDSKHWKNNRAYAALSYKHIGGEVSLSTGEDDALVLITTIADKTFTSTIKQRNSAVVIDFDKVDLSLFTVIKPLLQALVPNMKSQFDQMALSGQAHGRFTIALDADNKPQRIARAKISLIDFGLHSAEFAIDHVNTDITASAQQVAFVAKLKDSQLILPFAFKRALPSVSGEITGTFDSDQRALNISQVTLSNSDMTLLSMQGSIEFGSSPAMAINGEARRFNLAALSNYIPEQMPPKTAAWLKQAFVSGKDNQTQFTLKGPLRHFFEQNEAILVTTTFKDGLFRYAQNNPPLHLQNANLEIDGKSLTAHIKKSYLATRRTKNHQAVNIPVTGQVRVADMQKAIVAIDVSISQQPLLNLRDLVEQSSVKRSWLRIDKIIKDASGVYDAIVKIKLDERKKIDAPQKSDTFDLTMRAKNASASLRDFPGVRINNASTEIHIDSKGLKRLVINGLSNRQRLDLNVNRMNKGYQISGKGRVDPIKMLLQFKLINKAQSELIAQYQLLRGSPNARLRLFITHDGKIDDLHIDSALDNTALNLFGVVVKSAKTRLPLSISFQERSRQLQLRLEKRLRLVTAIGKNADLSGLLIDNFNPRRDYQTGKYQFYLRSKAFDFKRFFDFTQQYKALAKHVKKQKTMPGLSQWQFDVAIDALAIAEKVTLPFTLKGNVENLSIQSPWLSGQISYQDTPEKNRLSADLERLEIDRLYYLLTQTYPFSSDKVEHYADWFKNLPAMAIKVGQFVYRNKTIGSANLNTSIRQDGGVSLYSIDQLLVQGRQYFLEGSGHEAAEPQGISTHLQLQFKGEKLRDIIKLLQLNETVDARFLDVNMALAWQGKAYSLNLKRSYGKASLQAQNVKLLNVSSGLGGVFGIMDIAGILKRVSLDFKNLTTSKIAFDSVSGSWNIGGGRAVANQLSAEGSVIDTRIKGALVLGEQIFDDLILTIIPKASNVLPVIGMVTGGVAGAAAGLLVQQTIGDAINKINEFSYVISGPWSKPVIHAKKAKIPPQTKPGIGDKKRSPHAIQLESL